MPSYKKILIVGLPFLALWTAFIISIAGTLFWSVLVGGIAGWQVGSWIGDLAVFIIDNWWPDYDN